MSTAHVTRLSRNGQAPADEGSADRLDDAIKLVGLTKSFGPVQAVRDLSLTIRPGETVALLGPNGAGKTTTISMLLGLVAPDRGTASVLGMPPATAIQRGRIGAMLQEGSLMPGVRVGELLDYVLGLTASSLSRTQLAATAQLTGLERRRVDRLSGGQTQRLRFALAIASDPEVLVLDEPTAAMDVESRQTFWAGMRAYTSGGRTALFATHYLEEAEAFASRVVIIAGGQTVADGTVAELTSALSKHSVRFQVAGAPDAGLAQLDGVREVETKGTQVTLMTSNADATVRALLRSGVLWSNLEVHGASLEDVFLSYVGGKAA